MMKLYPIKVVSCFAGWYSVFNSDRETVDLLKHCFEKLRKEVAKQGPR